MERDRNNGVPWAIEDGSPETRRDAKADALPSTRLGQFSPS